MGTLDVPYASRSDAICMVHTLTKPHCNTSALDTMTTLDQKDPHGFHV